MQSTKQNCADALQAALLDEYEDSSLGRAQSYSASTGRNKQQQQHQHGQPKQDRFYLYEYYEQNPTKKASTTLQDHGGTRQPPPGHGHTPAGSQQGTSRPHGDQLHREEQRTQHQTGQRQRVDTLGHQLRFVGDTNPPLRTQSPRQLPEAGSSSTSTSSTQSILQQSQQFQLEKEIIQLERKVEQRKQTLRDKDEEIKSLDSAIVQRQGELNNIELDLYNTQQMLQKEQDRLDHLQEQPKDTTDNNQMVTSKLHLAKVASQITQAEQELDHLHDTITKEREHLREVQLKGQEYINKANEEAAAIKSKTNDELQDLQGKIKTLKDEHAVTKHSLETELHQLQVAIQKARTHLQHHQDRTPSAPPPPSPSNAIQKRVKAKAPQPRVAQNFIQTEEPMEAEDEHQALLREGQENRERIIAQASQIQRQKEQLLHEQELAQMLGNAISHLKSKAKSSLRINLNNLKTLSKEYHEALAIQQQRYELLVEQAENNARSYKQQLLNNEDLEQQELEREYEQKLNELRQEAQEQKRIEYEQLPAIQHIQDSHDEQQRLLEYIQRADKAITTYNPDTQQTFYQDIQNIQKQALTYTGATIALTFEPNIDAIIANQKELYSSAASLITANQSAVRNTLLALRNHNEETTPATKRQHADMTDRDNDDSPNKRTNTELQDMIDDMAEDDAIELHYNDNDSN